MYNRPKLGEILIRHNSASREQVEAALGAQKADEKSPLPRLGQYLVEAEVITETELLKALADQFCLDFEEDIDPEEADISLSSKLPYTFAMEHKVIPFQRMGGMVLTALGDPLDTEALDLVRSQVGVEPLPVLAPIKVIEKLITDVYAQRGGLEDIARGIEDSEESPGDDDSFEKIEDILANSGGDDEGPIIQLVNSIFKQSVGDGASDIHIEPMEEHVLIRFRIDGVLHEVIRASKRFQNSIIVRIKIMAELNIAEKRLPQDGRIRFRIAGRDIDVRVATAPAAFGERITMRLLDRQSVLVGLADLGLSPHNLDLFEHALKQPHGIILVTGPTGSGKTTTLYAGLNHINTPDQNILTVEDPVEYQLAGISQMQVNPKIGLTFASGLRSYLRHDPDVIMVGEIRDVETAEIAIQAALTGHLVLSTIHTNDAAGAFSRLMDMGVEPFLVSSSLQIAMAQRLLRRLCKYCKEPYAPSDAELERLEVPRERLEAAGGIFFRPKTGGCPECKNLGYSGRTAIHEMLVVTDAIRHLVMQRSDASTIRRAATKNGMKNMREDGGLKILQGITSTSEVLRVTLD